MSRETGFPGYRAGSAGSATTVAFTAGERIRGIWAWAATGDGTFSVTTALGGSASTADWGNPITVRTPSGREWNPTIHLVNATVVFSSALDWMIEFTKLSS